MKKSFFTHRTPVMWMKSIFTLFLLAASIYLSRCLYVNLTNIHDVSDALLTILSVVYTVGTWGWFTYCLKSLVTRIHITEKEVYLTRYGRKIVTVQWASVVEVGMGCVTSPGGEIRKLYFAEKKLTEQQKNNLDLAQKDCIYFSTVPSELYDLLAQYSSLPLPKEADGLQRRSL